MAGRELPSRSTRGKRFSTLIGEEAEKDQQYWSQEYFADEAEDVEYNTDEEEEEDEVDSDFDVPVEETEQKEADEREVLEKNKKKAAYVDPKKSKKRAREEVSEPKGSAEIEEKITQHRKENSSSPTQETLLPSTPTSTPISTLTDKEETGVPKKGRPKKQANTATAPAEVKNTTPMSVRKSTRTLSVVKAAEREERSKIETGKKKTQRTRKKAEVKRLTQEELLQEAKYTEKINLASLEAFLKIEEMKKKAMLPKQKQQGPMVKYHSKGDVETITFTSSDTIPQCFGSTSPTVKLPMICPVTGLRAKYRDPLTGTPYATLEAFKIIRQKHASVS